MTCITCTNKSEQDETLNKLTTNFQNYDYYFIYKIETIKKNFTSNLDLTSSRCQKL